jgi:hypothetical protein
MGEIVVAGVQDDLGLRAGRQRAQRAEIGDRQRINEPGVAAAVGDLDE